MRRSRTSPYRTPTSLKRDGTDRRTETRLRRLRIVAGAGGRFAFAAGRAVRRRPRPQRFRQDDAPPRAAGRRAPALRRSANRREEREPPRAGAGGLRAAAADGGL